MSIKCCFLIASICSILAFSESSVCARAIPAAELEASLVLPDQSLDGLGNSGAIEGSGLFLVFLASPGDTVSFRYNFLTNEALPTGLDVVNDFAFATLDAMNIQSIADTYTPRASASGGYGSQTGYQTFSAPITAQGTYVLRIGVADVVDGANDSALLLDDFRLSGATFPNGGFEGGLPDGLCLFGDASLVSSAFGINPSEGGRQILLTTAVPEPSTCLLLAIGVTLVGWMRFRSI